MYNIPKEVIIKYNGKRYKLYSNFLDKNIAERYKEIADMSNIDSIIDIGRYYIENELIVNDYYHGLYMLIDNYYLKKLAIFHSFRKIFDIK